MAEAVDNQPKIAVDPEVERLDTMTVRTMAWDGTTARPRVPSGITRAYHNAQNRKIQALVDHSKLMFGMEKPAKSTIAATAPERCTGVG